MTRKLSLIALNEFNRHLLENAAQSWKLQNILEFIKLKHTKTKTQDTYDSDFLEPWVQWVNVQTGLDSRVHGIKHLGDIPNLEVPQIWEVLSKAQVSCGIWGALNASLRKPSDASFFVPDPWTFSQNASNKTLQNLINLPRYLAKNYLSVNPFTALKHLCAFMSSLIKYPKAIGDCIKNLPLLVSGILRHPKEIFVYFCFAELILARIFLEEKKRHNVDFSMYFINGIAHLQHYDWSEGKLENNFRFKYGFECVDRILKLFLYYKNSNEEFILMNALSQTNTNHEEAWNSYKIIDPKKLFKELGINYDSIEPLMSYDGHILFSNLQNAERAFLILKNIKIKNQNLFLVEANPKDRLKLFYRAQYYAPLENDAEFFNNSNSFRFFDYFKCLTTRTGKHISSADLYTSIRGFPKEIMNHEVASLIYSFFELGHSDSLSSKETRVAEVATRLD